MLYQSLAREETNLFRFTSWCSPKTLHPTFYSLRSYYICTISFGVLLDKWCVGGILQVHRRWLYMNHTKAMLTDILLHLRKRAERGIRFGGSWQHGGSGVLPGPAALRRGPGAFAGGRGPYRTPAAPWRNTPESISFSWASKWAWSWVRWTCWARKRRKPSPMPGRFPARDLNRYPITVLPARGNGG